MAHQIVFILCSIIALTGVQGIHGVKFQATNNAAGTAGGIRFTNEIGITYSRATLKAATQFIWQSFHQTSAADRKNVPLLSMVVESMDGVAYTINNKIHVSANYIEGYRGDVKREITGVIYHEVAHV
uniref:Uncharacterized protein n=1 Tax=Nelumbo nucifera TaxID=4432 RepID=A0A822XRK5_NELNU|nr:TPA_asm: hypothetical protein HUJ06_022868 [Nelumbo nucifera]